MKNRLSVRRQCVSLKITHAGIGPADSRRRTAQTGLPGFVATVRLPAREGNHPADNFLSTFNQRVRFHGKFNLAARCGQSAHPPPPRGPPTASSHNAESRPAVSHPLSRHPQHPKYMCIRLKRKSPSAGTSSRLPVALHKHRRQRRRPAHHRCAWQRPPRHLLPDNHLPQAPGRDKLRRFSHPRNKAGQAAIAASFSANRRVLQNKRTLHVRAAGGGRLDNSKCAVADRFPPSQTIFKSSSRVKHRPANRGGDSLSKRRNVSSLASMQRVVKE